MLEDDLRERLHRGSCRGPAGPQAEFQRAREASARPKPTRCGANEWINPGGSGLPARLRVRALLEDNELVPERAWRAWARATPGQGPAHSLLPRAPSVTLSLGYLHSVFRRGRPVARCDRAVRRKRRIPSGSWSYRLMARACWSSLAQAGPGQAVSLPTTSPTRPGERAFSATSTRICPRRAHQVRPTTNPEFVEEFISTAHWYPALAGVGHKVVRLIDPACGSGALPAGRLCSHLEALARTASPARTPRELVQRTLDAVCGVGPQSVCRCESALPAIVGCLAGVWDHAVAGRAGVSDQRGCGGSLLHGPWPGNAALSKRWWARTRWRTVRGGDKGRAAAAARAAISRVVGNPPYISPSDPGMAVWYRRRLSALSG